MDCTGYACPPGHSVPAGEVIVKMTTTLAETGHDWSPVLVAIGIVLLLFGALIREGAK